MDELIFNLEDEEKGIATWIIRQGDWYRWFQQTPQSNPGSGCRSKDLTHLTRWASAWFTVMCQAYPRRNTNGLG